MHDAYGNRWFKSLIFTQATTQRDSTGKEKVSTWYESLRHTDATGTQLRIDMGDPKVGNGVLYTADAVGDASGAQLGASLTAYVVTYAVLLGSYIVVITHLAGSGSQ